jgi:hypothetical protein
LTPIAAREHWVALVFAALAGAVFLGAILLVVVGTVQQAIVSLVASAAPGFLSAVFFSREATIEKQLSEISSDLRESEKMRERLAALEEVLGILPANIREDVAKSLGEKLFET